MKIYVKQLYDDKGIKIPISLPEKGSPVSAGYDIVATSDPKIVGHTVDNVFQRIDYIEYETNLFIAPSTETFHTLIHPRSSVSKYNIVLANSIGLVDNDYRGMVICRFKYIFQPEDLVFAVDNGSFAGCLGMNVNMEKIYKKGDKIAQLVVEPTVNVEWRFVDDLTQTQRGEGGFGSTDKESTAEGTLKAAKIIIDNMPPGNSLADLYQKTGGIPVKKKYTEEIRQRDQ